MTIFSHGAALLLFKNVQLRTHTLMRMFIAVCLAFPLAIFRRYSYNYFMELYIHFEYNSQI